MSNSILDQSQEFNREEAIKELMRALIQGFYTKEHLHSTTDLTPSQIAIHTRIELKKHLIKTTFKEDIKIYDMIVEQLELRYRSKHRMGRTEGIGALSMHIIQSVSTRMQSLMDKFTSGQ